MITPVGFCPVCTEMLDTCVCLYPGVPLGLNPLPTYLRQLRLGLRVRGCSDEGGHVWLEHGMDLDHVCAYCGMSARDLSR